MNNIEFFDIVLVIGGGVIVSIIALVLGCLVLDFIKRMNWSARILVLVVIAGLSYFGYNEYHRYQVYYKLGMAPRYLQSEIKLPIVSTDVQHNDALRERMIAEVREHLVQQNQGDATFDVTAIQYEGASWYHFNKIVIEYRLRASRTLGHVTIDVTPDPEETLRFCEGLVETRLQSQAGLLDVSASE